MSKQINGIPTVSTFRFLRHARQILKNPLPFHHANFERLGDTFNLKISPKQSLLFSRNPEFATYVLQKNQKNFNKSKIQTEDLAKYIGRGLLTSEGDLWKTQRKLIQPAFHKKQLANLLDEVQIAIHKEIGTINTEKAIDIFSIMNDLAFQTVVKALFSGAASENDIAELQNVTETAQKMLISELRQPYKQFWYSLTGKIKKNVAYTRQSRTILKQIVNDRKTSGERKNDLLDMLLDARYDDGTSMEEEQLLDEILILFTAGHETTSNALTFTCELLARHQEVQELLIKEIDDLASQDLDLMQLVQQSTYVNAVINEVMRLYPPAYFIDRLSIEESEFDGMRIPAKSNILFSVLEIHHHQHYWENPEVFQPERFLDQKSQNFTAYFPFGAGPRKCIGNNFAMFEMILAIHTLFKNFRIEEKSTPIEILPLITLKPKNAILKFTSR
ncbi:cytochrome P450 [Zhouia sp. PK063]|uniref:cytochrome P450 n=1 Tax=Zhouia sp. PK063 TaxID=3373602 RepID=UPI00378B1C74